MIAAAILGLIGVGVLSSIQFAAAESARTRARTFAASEAQTVIDRVIALATIVANAGSLAETTADQEALFCGLLTGPYGPIDRTAGTPVGACPDLVVQNMNIPGSTLKRTVEIDSQPLGAVAGYVIKVRVSGGQLPAPGYVEISTHIRR